MANGDISTLGSMDPSVNARFWCSARIRSQALFLEVMTEKTGQHCSTLWLRQWGQTTPPAS